MFEINGWSWRLLYVPPWHPKLQRSDGSYTLGVCDGYDQIIYINDDLSCQLERKVLCHELVHASLFSYGIEMDIWQEEIVADLFASYGEEIIEITKREVRC